MVVMVAVVVLAVGKVVVAAVVVTAVVVGGCGDGQFKWFIINKFLSVTKRETKDK